MSKGLEVWNNVKKYLNLYHHQVVKENIDVKTVEGMPIDIIEKELKTLEIIKEKRVDIGVFRFCESANDYNRAIERNENGLIHYKEITQEEYDLLKEELQ